jgi:hypothetical protein
MVGPLGTEVQSGKLFVDDFAADCVHRKLYASFAETPLREAAEVGLSMAVGRSAARAISPLRGNIADLYIGKARVVRPSNIV